MAPDHFLDDRPATVDVGAEEPPLRGPELAGVVGFERAAESIPPCRPRSLDATEARAERGGEGQGTVGIVVGAVRRRSKEGGGSGPWFA